MGGESQVFSDFLLLSSLPSSKVSHAHFQIMSWKHFGTADAM